MSEFIEIVKSKNKPKEKTAILSGALKNDNKIINELIAYFPTAPIAERGLCIEAISEITKEDPKFADCCLEFVVAQINDKAPRVKWEAATVVANAAVLFPERVAKAIPALIKNTEDEGTVVRWSAAKGLTEIAKNYPESQKKLLGMFAKIIEVEDNNGVKNIYVKALKAIEKDKRAK
jgi:HEAT repeat protein